MLRSIIGFCLLGIVLSFTCDNLVTHTIKNDCIFNIRFRDVCPHHQRHFTYGIQPCNCTDDMILLLERSYDSYECIEVHQGPNGCVTIEDIEKRVSTCITL